MTDTHKIIDGKTTARRVLDDAKAKAAQITAAHGAPPCLAAVLVGSDPASATYVRMKRKRCQDAGVKSVFIELPQETTTDQLLDAINKLAADPTVHGILLQHPVPPQIDERAAFEAIPPAKDVDGVTATGLGHMWLGLPGFGSCTPAGIMTLLNQYNVPLQGADAIVIGRSPILGKPMAAMLLDAHATVTIAHSRTQNLPDIVRRADIVVAAVGRPQFVKGDWIKPGAVVIDAGYNQGNVGDVDYDAAFKKASLITPVPGGVGPMTLATLIEQTVDAAQQQLNT